MSERFLTPGMPLRSEIAFLKGAEAAFTPNSRHL